MKKNIGVIASYNGELVVDNYANVIVFKDSDHAAQTTPSESIIYRLVKSNLRKKARIEVINEAR